ncbi:MAG: hypothetical protein FGM33_03595 [Candidatus Kapabacteria bacterium]|nr:hypothetical protein [Candidatus Kapabacteria bacterium]
MMNVAQSPLIQDLFSITSKPCLSLYLPTHRTQPERRDDQTRYRQLVRTLSDSLKTAYADDGMTDLLAPFRALERDDAFWNSRRQGLAVFRAPGVFITQHLDRSVPEIAVVADHFHVKPLFRLLQTLEDYNVLCLTRESAQLFVGNRDGLEEVSFATGPMLLINEILGDELSDPGFSNSNSGGTERTVPHTTIEDEVDKDTERFFRHVDRLVMEIASRATGLPLVVASLPEQAALFHRISRNPNLVDASIIVNPFGIELRDLVQRAWETMRPFALAESQTLIEAYDEAAGHHDGIDGIFSIAQAAVEGRIATLFVEDSRQIPGKIDELTGKVVFDDLAMTDVNDLLDDIARIVLKHGGTVIVLPTNIMPTSTGAAAILRY